MSKIGRKPIALGGTKVEVKGQAVHYSGGKASGVYTVHDDIEVLFEDALITLKPRVQNRDTNMIWGLHRALLANKIKGADVGFVRKLQIIGLGYKAILKGRNIELSLGFSHKINYELPEGVDLSTDKSGQNLTFSSYDKEVLGTVCSQIRSMRPPEPYKGTGVRYDDEIVARKAGKSKA